MNSVIGIGAGQHTVSCLDIISDDTYGRKRKVESRERSRALPTLGVMKYIFVVFMNSNNFFVIFTYRVYLFRLIIRTNSS